MDFPPLIEALRSCGYEGGLHVELSRHSHMGADAVRRAAEAYGAGSGAAPLITGYAPAHASAERAIARWKGTEAAVLFPSGFQANLAVVQALATLADRAGRPVRFFLDKLCHASLIDAARAVWRPPAVSFRPFPHNGTDKLARDVGWRPRRTFRETVERTYEWFTRERIAEQVAFDFAFEDELLGHCEE